MKIELYKTKYHRFSLTYDYDQATVEFCRGLKDGFGWQKFSYATEPNGRKHWVFSDALFAKLFHDNYGERIEITPEAQEVIDNEYAFISEKQRTKEKADAVRAKTDTDFVVKNIKGEPYPYQKIGVEFLIASKGRAIIADAPGVGKSMQALGYIAHQEFRRSLVVAPASVKFAWANETAKWTKMKSIVIDSKTKLEDISHDTEIWIINYDILKKHLPQLLKIHFDCLVFDEAHYLKSPKTLRTKAAKMLSQHVPHLVLLTGTPLLSRPVELFVPLHLIDPRTWNNYYDFGRQYCDAKPSPWGGFDMKGSSNEAELHERIRSYFIRRTKDEVLKHLPPKQRIDLPVSLPAAIQKEYDTAEDDFATYLREFKKLNRRQITQSLAAEKLTRIGHLRQILARGKVDAAKEVINSVLESDEKIIVFSSYRAVLDLLKEEYGDTAVMITGETPMEDREYAVESFQKKKNVKIFLGGIKSAGVGITLTAASNVLFVDYSWNPADHKQGEDRAHRPGADYESLSIYHLYARGTVDHRFQKILQRKQDIFDQVIEGRLVEDDTDMFAEVEEYIKNKYEK